MKEIENNTPSEESVIKAMELAWKDHHHARDQTWKTVQIVAVLGAGLITVDFNYKSDVATLLAAILVILSASWGILITWHHRKLERRKFLIIMNCEEFLNLHDIDLLPLEENEILIGRMKKIAQQNSKKGYFEDINIESRIRDLNMESIINSEEIRKAEINKGSKEKYSMIKDASVSVPKKFKILDIINPTKNNTSLFILRMHISIIIFSILIVLLRLKLLS